MKLKADTPIWQLTVGQFRELMRECTAQEEPSFATTDDNIVIGLRGLSELLGMSYTKASQLKSSGILDAACTQFGRKIIFNKTKLFAILEKENLSNKYCKKLK